jgi:hypothetical protein
MVIPPFSPLSALTLMSPDYTVQYFWNSYQPLHKTLTVLSLKLTPLPWLESRQYKTCDCKYSLISMLSTLLNAGFVWTLHFTLYITCHHFLAPTKKHYCSPSIEFFPYGSLNSTLHYNHFLCTASMSYPYPFYFVYQGSNYCYIYCEQQEKPHKQCWGYLILNSWLQIFVLWPYWGLN